MVGACFTVKYIESKDKDTVARVLESGYDQWYYAAAIWHSIGNERKIFSFGIRAFLAAIKYSENEDFDFAEAAFCESIYAFSKIKSSLAFDFDENPEYILKRIISVMNQFLPKEHADAVASYIESNKDLESYFGNDEISGIL